MIKNTVNPAEQIDMLPKQKSSKLNRFLRLKLCYLMLLFFTVFSGVSLTPKPVEARCCVCCPQPILSGYHSATRSIVNGAIDAMFNMLTDSLLTNVWWSVGVRPILSELSQELTLAGWMPVVAFGAQIDGKLHQETILEMQVLKGKTFKRHVPAVSMCKFASLNKSLAQSDMRANMVHSVLNEYSLRRQLGQAETAGALGKAQDLRSRIKLVEQVHCNPQDLDGTLQFICTGATGANGKTNKDVNFSNAIDIPDTINLSFDSAVTIPADQQELLDVVAIKQMLYKHELPPRIGKKNFSWNNTGNIRRYLDWRQTAAKRSVAENSFDNLVGMKAASGNAVNNQYNNLLRTLGMSAAQANEITKAAPSYWAQMEALTKKLYQNPEFFANLYDNPANVTRQSASMEAINLMQQRDYYESLIRSEMALAVLLDTEVQKEQDVLNSLMSQWGY